MLNTQDRYGASVLVPAANAGGGLNYDSYAELSRVVVLETTDFAALAAVGAVEVMGSLDRWALRQVQQAAALADTLTEIERQIILRAIADRLAEL